MAGKLWKVEQEDVWFDEVVNLTTEMNGLYMNMRRV
jgi:hypothetical protein